MHHLHIDRFAGLTSPVHSLDPRAKLFTSLAFILLVILTPVGYFFSYFFYFVLVSGIIAISHVPVMYILKRSLTILPFAVAVSFFVPFITPGPPLWELQTGFFTIQITSTGMILFLSLGAKSFLSFFTVITLVSSTQFGDLMWAAGKLGLPSKLVIVVSFMYRYLFLLIDEASHMLLARDLRSIRKRKNPLLLASGGIIGALLIRSFEHAEKLYYAMLLRGYTGHPSTLHVNRFEARDIVLPVFFIVLAAIGRITGGYLYV